MKEFAEWLSALPKPVGILTVGLEHARTVVNTCTKLGINVPHDVAVLCGTHDEILSYSCYPPLSGIKAPAKQIGYRAAQLMHAMLQGESVTNEPEYIAPSGVVAALSTETQAVSDPKLVQAQNFIQQHAFENFTMEDLLRQVPMSRRSLERRFFNTYGRTVFDEVRHIRINKARKLLVETDLKMQYIAEACGYTTYNNMGTVFKQVTDMTPSKYRKLYQT